MNSLLTNTPTLSNVENNFMNIVNKPFHIKTFQWTGVAAPTVNLATATTLIPQDLLINDMVKVPFQTSRYWKGNICLEIQALGTPMHQGLLVVYFKPLASSLPLAKADSINDALASPHVFIYANQSTSACLTIPFCVPTGYASTVFTQGASVYNREISSFISNLGYVNAMVITPLDSSSTTTINVAMSAIFKNMEFKVPKNELMVVPLKVAEKTPEEIAKEKSDFAKKKELEKSIGGKQKRDIGEDSISQDIKFQAMLMPALATIATAALPNVIRFVRDGIDRFNKKFWTWIGLDKPTNPLVNENVRVTTTTNYNNTVGIVPLDRLTMHTNHLSLAPSTVFPCEYDEMSMDYILSKHQFVKQFTIKETDVIGTAMCTIPIGPMCVPPVLRENVNLPIITKLAMCTKYWRGDIDFHFRVSATDMQTCKILIVKTYGLGAYTSIPKYTDLVNFDCETIEINHGGQEFTVSCPYNSPVPMSCNDMYYQSSYVQHGELFVYILTPLQYPVSAQPYITMSVYITAGKNFSFYGPTEYATFLPSYNYTTAGKDEASILDAEKIEAKKKLEKLEIKLQSVQVALGDLEEDSEVPQEVKPVLNHMAPIKHLRDIFRRYYLTRATKFNTSTGVIVFKLSDIFRSRLYNTPLSMLSNFYEGFRGGLRFRLVSPVITQGYKVSAYYSFPLLNTSTTPPSATTMQTNLNEGASWEFDAPATTPGPLNYIQAFVTYNQVDSCLDFEIPNENPFLWNKIHNTSTLGSTTDFSADLGYLYVVFPKETYGISSAPLYRLYVSMADESRVGIFNHNTSVFLQNNTGEIASNFNAAVPASYDKYFSKSTY